VCAAPARVGVASRSVSGYIDDPTLRRGISENEVEFLSKPFSPSRLVTCVREVLERPLHQPPGHVRPS